MVSFQCHACSDVVKKPKLDQHRSRCGSGFDCIDCSTTFNTPAEYKGHTQCISEAEKYQKSLYKGAKAVRCDNPGSAPRNNYPPSMNGSVPQRQFGYGGRGRGGGRGGWGQPRTVATGANDTPLGTPARSTPTPITISHSASKVGVDAVRQSPAVVEVPRELSEKKKEKRKAIPADVDESLQRTSKKVKVTESEAVDPSSITPSPASADTEQKSKKDKRKKKDKEEKRDAAEEQDGEARERKKKRKAKKESKSGCEESVPAEEAGEKKRHKKKRAEDTIEISGQDVEMKEVNVDEKQKKKSKKDKKERGVRESSEAGSTSKKPKRHEIEGDGFEQEMVDNAKEVDYPAAGSQDSHKAKKEKRVKKDKDGKKREKKSERLSMGSVHAQ